MDVLELIRRAIRGEGTWRYIDAAGQECETLVQAQKVRFLAPDRLEIVTEVPKSAPTNYRVAADSAETFTVDAILTAYELRDSALSEYLQASASRGIRFVGVTERKRLLQYLRGELQTVPHLQQIAQDNTLPRPSAEAQVKSYAVNPEDAAIVLRIRSYEREIRTCQSVLHGQRKGNFENVLNIVADRMSPTKDGLLHSQQQDPVPRSRRGKNVNPIIMLSSSPSAILNMVNIKKFLEEGLYEHPDQARDHLRAEMGRDVRTESVVIVNHQRGERTVRYMVVDSVQSLAKFGGDAWDRVVAVFTTGQEWQFKSYRYSDPKVLFQRTKGFIALWANESANPKVKDWNVYELRIDRQRRHTDKACVANFWRVLEAWQFTHEKNSLKG